MFQEQTEEQETENRRNTAMYHALSAVRNGDIKEVVEAARLFEAYLKNG